MYMEYAYYVDLPFQHILTIKIQVGRKPDILRMYTTCDLCLLGCNMKYIYYEPKDLCILDTV